MKNHLKKTCIYFIFVLNLLSLSSANTKNITSKTSSKSPEDPLSGVWKGYLTQKHGGIAGKYNFAITFKLQNDNRITGESRLDLPDGTFGIITLMGEKLNKKIFVKELSIKEQKIDSGFWCIKKYTLTLKNKTLKGTWFGCIANSDEPEGEIYLERK